MQVGSVRAEIVVEIPELRFAAADFFDRPDAVAIRALEPELPAGSFEPEAQTLLLSHHSWLLDTGSARILVDPCVGNFKTRRVFAAYDMLDTPWLDRLATAGARPQVIDYVFCTHLHVDHCGWNTRLENGRWVPTFPNARYLFARAEHDFWIDHRNDTAPIAVEVNYGVYDDSVLPVLESDQAVLLEAPYCVAGCLTLEPGPGHTPGHMVGLLDGGRMGWCSPAMLCTTRCRSRARIGTLRAACSRKPRARHGVGCSRPAPSATGCWPPPTSPRRTRSGSPATTPAAFGSARPPDQRQAEHFGGRDGFVSTLRRQSAPDGRRDPGGQARAPQHDSRYSVALIGPTSVTPPHRSRSNCR